MIKALISLALLIMALPALLWEGFVVSTLWRWFLVPTLNAPIITAWQAAGIGMIVSMMTMVRKKDEDKTDEEAIADFLHYLWFWSFVPAMMLLFGRIVLAFAF